MEPRLLLSATALDLEPFADEPLMPEASAAMVSSPSTESPRFGTDAQTPIVEASGSGSSPFLDVTLDYTYDINNFFDTQAKRDLLELAVDEVASGFTDALAAIEPDEDNSWTAVFTHPGTGDTEEIENLVVGERELIIFPGGRDLGGPLAQGGPGGFSSSGTQEWHDTVRGRGQEGALDDPATNFGPWGGMVTFDTEADWHFDETTDGLTTSEFDFLSVAMHEVTHVFGFTHHVDAFANLVDEDNLVFTGERATALYEGDGHPPLAAEDDLSHWEAGFTHDGEVSVMTPTISPGERQAMTDLDIATLKDIGWTSLADLIADDIHTEGLAEHEFTVVYDSSTDLDVDTLIDNDEAIRVTGPDGFDTLASYVDIDEPTDGPMREVTYAAAGPDDEWNAEDDGTYAVKLEPNQVADVHGNFVPAGTLGTFDVEIDTTPPSTSIQLSGTPGNGPWFRSAVEVTLEATDDLSGVDKIEYHFGDDQWQTYEEPFTVSDDGITTIHYRATDNADNVEDTRTGNLHIDTVTPTTTRELAGEEGENGWFTSDVTLSLEATDDVSGVDVIEYHLGDGNWQVYDTDNALEFTDDGVTDVHYRATDVAGNVEDTQSVDVKIDTVAPVSTVDLDGDEGNDPWFVSPVDVTLTAEDDTSGVDAIEYHLGDGNWQVFDAGAGLELTDNGTTTLHHRAVDVAGHTEDAQSVEVHIDTVAPTTTRELAGEEGENGWFTSDVTLSLEATDDVSGVDVIKYHLGEGNWQVYDTDNALEFTDDGVTDVHYRATDEAGNVEDTQSVEVKIDTVGPVSTVELDGEEGNDPWFTSPVDVTLTAKDDTSGVDVIEYHLGDGNWQVYDTAAGLELTDNGMTTLHHRAVDVAGHFEDAQSVEVHIDTAPPTADAVVDDIVAEPDDEAITPEVEVAFSDNLALDLSSIMDNDEAIRVTGPDGFDALARYVDDDDDADDSTHQATYRLDAIGESWHDAQSGTYVVHLEAGQVQDAAGNVAEAGEVGSFDVSVPGQVATVLGRHVFYNNAAFDGGDAGPGAHNDAALAPDKDALLPGETSTAANYTSYSRGLNGIMIDIAALAEAEGLSEGDFEFLVGNDSSPDSWEQAPEPIHIHVREGAGVDGSDRIEVIWADNAIENTWLEVTVRANEVTGLENPDVFYFGNAIGQTGDGDSVASIRENQTGFGSADLDNAYDVNRDGRVSLADVLLARAHQAEAQTLASISVPAPPAETSAPIVESQQSASPVDGDASGVSHPTSTSNDDDSAAPIDALASLQPLDGPPSHEQPQTAWQPARLGFATIGHGPGSEPFGLSVHDGALRGPGWSTDPSDDDDDDEKPWWSANLDIGDATVRLL